MAKYYRRGHWVNMPSRSGGKGGSGWLIAAIVAVALWVLVNGGGDGEAQPEPSKSGTPASEAPAP
ncbi:hypothetical protein ACQP1W_28650 [Spirillospora sp. CA-255316]